LKKKGQKTSKYFTQAKVEITTGTHPSSTARTAHVTTVISTVRDQFLGNS
jgi:hypothetical protein